MAATYKKISSTTLSSAQSQIVFSSIPQTYNDLALWISVKDASTNFYLGTLRIRFNSDTGHSYRYTTIGGGRSTGSMQVWLASASNSEVEYGIGGLVPPSDSLFASGAYGKSEIYIADYSSSISQKPFNIQFSQYMDPVTANAPSYIIQGAGVWNPSGSKPAINSITLYSSSLSNFVAGSSATLYGISKT